MLEKKKTKLQEEMKLNKENAAYFEEEAAILQLSYDAVIAKKEEYIEYNKSLSALETMIRDMENNRQQADNAKESAADFAKVIEVARRIAKGDIVPPKDEQKLLEYSFEMYQAAKNMAAMNMEKEKEEHDSLWEDEEKGSAEVNPDPQEVAANSTAPAGPAIVSVEDTIASAIENS